MNSDLCFIHLDGNSEIINQKSEIIESCGLQVAFYQYLYSSAPNSHLFSLSAFSGKARR